jgi:ADP-ribosylglycohydrolase
MSNYIKASLCIGSYLDTLGYNNGNWEFNFGNNVTSLQSGAYVMNEIVSQYFALGGNDIDISKWFASDDTMMMIAVKKAVMKGGSNKDYIDEFLKIRIELAQEKRGSGFTTLKNLKRLSKYKKLNLKYSDEFGGNGAAMRTAFIGLYYSKDEDFDKLIHQSIYSSRLTHNYIYGFLGGYVTALFCSYAIKKINPFEWVDLLLKSIPKVDEYMRTTDIFKEYNNDKDKFWDYWRKYKEDRLPYFEYKSSEYLFSGDRYNKLLEYTPGVTKKNPSFNKMGATGIGALIIAYDSLLMSYNFDKEEFIFNNLVFFSTLHFGDNDTTGIIAGNWYGAYYGLKYFNDDKINMLEFKKELNYN